MYKIGQVEMNFRSIADLSAAISTNLNKVPRDVDVIVGIPRSGVHAASIISLGLKLPLTNIDGLIN
jgi:orotate phosphoribosyltransferase-like protein